MTEASPLNSPFDQLGMDNQFIKQAKNLGILTIEDVMKANLEKLKQHKAFTFTWYADMLGLLKEHDLIRQFQENQL